MEKYTFGKESETTVLIQMVDEHSLETLEAEVQYLRELTDQKPFYLMALKVNHWNDDLSPWEAPAVFGNQGFHGGADGTVNEILREMEELEMQDPDANDSGKRVFYLGGYSLAGLFALHAGYHTDRFSGIAAVSPSIWFPGFVDVMRSHEPVAGKFYLSLGDKEARTGNPVKESAVQELVTVGDCIREVYRCLKDRGRCCTLEWNKGNHFQDVAMRMAKGFAWLMRCSEDNLAGL